MRVIGVEQFAVFDQQQGVDNQPGDVLKAQINPLGVQGSKDQLVVPAPDVKPSLGFLVVDWKQAPCHRLLQGWRQARLLGNGIVLSREPVE